ncbi:MAG TPA: PAS domain S-box protein [Puia sp.]|nr:PAS domain S-box protein [Puia sp.]
MELASHSWLAAIIHSSEDAIISKTLDGIISSWNEGARRIFGYTAEEMIGTPILRLIPEDRHEEEPAILERLKRGERVDHFETKRITKDGRILDISLSISPIRDNNGRIIGASKIARNITDQKEAERIISEGRERFQKELEATVKERTRELGDLNTRLARSNYELEQFAYIASHDLQEPLRKIHIFSELLEEGLTGQIDVSKLNTYLEKIKGASNRMSKLIRDVLDYSRLSRADQSISHVSLNLVVKEVLHEFELVVAEKKAVIEVDALPVVRGISPQFHQLFRNLIGNALKFSTQQPKIVIRAEGHHIIIKDNGIGFPQEFAGKIFDIFQRLNSQDVYSGSGIGLALCKKIVENHGGTIKAESEPGKGSTFHIFLPA